MTDSQPAGILLSWVDLRTDPYARPRHEGDDKLPGPTLTLLFDPDSPYRRRIDRALLFYRQPKEAPRGHADFATADATRKEIERLSGDGPIDVELVPWPGEDPTDHRPIFEFLKPRILAVRDEASTQPLVVHISPGTPAMQTVWVLMAEMGLIRPPYAVVKSLPRAYRAGRPAVVPVSLDIPTVYKAFHRARPRSLPADEEPILMDPQRFESAALKALYRDARRYAALNAPILILGERGTGKTTLASWIRSNSPFREPSKDRSWPSVPCSQYSPETMRAELFGYVKGAFTDARQDTEGLLHVADGDTLFLDEVGDITRDLQRLLIRALEEKQFTRVGAQTPETSAFRLLTATNQPWSDLRDRLDPDFLDRISTFVLEVPPLRTVREDLPWLWRHLFHQALRRSGVPPGRVAVADDEHAAIVAALQRHPLPGNLRDVLRVAYHLIAHRGGEEDGTALDDILAAALHRGDAVEVDGAARLAQAVADAFAQREPLDGVLTNGDVLETRSVERAFRRYLAEEIRRIARTRGVQPQDLCDVTDRTLQQWVKLEP